MPKVFCLLVELEKKWQKEKKEMEKMKVKKQKLVTKGAKWNACNKKDLKKPKKCLESLLLPQHFKRLENWSIRSRSSLIDITAAQQERIYSLNISCWALCLIYSGLTLAPLDSWGSGKEESATSPCVLLRLRDLKSAAAAFSAAGLKPPPPPPPELLLLDRHGDPFWLLGCCFLKSVRIGSPGWLGCLATPNRREARCGNKSDFSRRSFRSLSTLLWVMTGASAEVLIGRWLLAASIFPLMSWKNLLKSQSLSSFCSSLDMGGLGLVKAALEAAATAAAAAAFYEFALRFKPPVTPKLCQTFTTMLVTIKCFIK